ncbi:hypothetical protein PGIGA_G00070550 [Pangasianodon gigas]|uniref:Uncharacterized protein n=1 Tax=Pangasianodon gigas TaxID=30993 RepID=A0ACC5X7A4_PANGG|nr:hypothetical protein [Pangasianodon gigas]
MDKRKDLSDFDKGQIVMALRLGQSVSETADLVGCSEFAVQEIISETGKDKGAVSTEEKGGAEKGGRRRPRKNPQV